MHDQNREASASKASLLEETVGYQGLPECTPRPRRLSSREHREILSEDMFREFLCLELKRASRSGRFFLLMLMEAGRIFRGNQRERVLSEIWSALSFCTRETDTSGWYQNASVLGVVFTQIGKAEKNLVRDLMRAKVTAALSTKLAAEQAAQIHFSFHMFPEESAKLNLGHSTGPKPDPELLTPGDATKTSRFAKRAIDIVGSIIALIFFSPLFIVISLAIKFSSRGPILFKQERVGHRGLRFTFLKFRSMKCANDSSIHREYVKRFIAGEIDSAQFRDNQNVYKILEDPRVTRVGKFLRKTSLDELPQFINVLKGEMSLVGPRPPIPYEMESYRPWHLRRVFEVKPGITGLWQVNGRSRTTFDEMVRLDLRYAKTWSLWLDIKILLQTPRAVLLGKGAY